MNPADQYKSELDGIMNETPSSSIPIKPPPPEAPAVKPDMNLVNLDSWLLKSNKLGTDYKFGVALAQFGENDLITHLFFKRLAAAICGTISNEFQKQGASAEFLKPHYNILESCLILLAKEIEKKELPGYDVSSIIACMHGFITNYSKKDLK